MYSSLIGKIEKAKRYAQERERVQFSQFRATFRGEHDSYSLSYQDAAWECSCPFFTTHRVCSHTMALQKILEGMVVAPEAIPAT